MFEQEVVEKLDLTQSKQTSVPTVAVESQRQPTDVAHHKKQWTPLTCGFCYGNPACGSAEPYKNSASLRRHLRHTHLAPLNNANEFPLTCPFPQCATTLTAIAHIVNHFCTAHGTNLGSVLRAHVSSVLEYPTSSARKSRGNQSTCQHRQHFHDQPQ